MSDLTPTEQEQVLETIVRNQLMIKELQEQNDQLKNWFKQAPDAFPAGFSQNVGRFYVKVTTNQRIDDTLARSELDERVYERLSKRVIDSGLAKKGLSPENYAKIVKKYDNKIEVGLV